MPWPARPVYYSSNTPGGRAAVEGLSGRVLAARTASPTRWRARAQRGRPAPARPGERTQWTRAGAPGVLLQ